MGTAPIVDLRANVEPDVSTRSEPNTATGFSYILNDPRFTRRRPACRRLGMQTWHDPDGGANEWLPQQRRRPTGASARLGSLSGNNGKVTDLPFGNGKGLTLCIQR